VAVDGLVAKSGVNSDSSSWLVSASSCFGGSRSCLSNMLSIPSLSDWVANTGEDIARKRFPLIDLKISSDRVWILEASLLTSVWMYNDEALCEQAKSLLKCGRIVVPRHICMSDL